MPKRPPNPQELNPNNPMTKAARDHWHAIAALVMRKAGLTRVEITLEDIAAANAQETNITIRDTGKAIVVELVDDATAKRLADQYQGSHGHN